MFCYFALANPVDMSTNFGDVGEQYVCNDLLVKLATRCNINCTYCYWFKDDTVYDLPALLLEEVEDSLIRKLEQHILKFRLKSFSVIFHGGEPLLFGIKRFTALMNKFTKLQKGTNCYFQYSVMTNGILINEKWIEIFKKHKIGVGVSLDGPKVYNDKRRIDFKGLGTFDRVKQNILLLKKNLIDPGIISVCSPSLHPKKLIEFFINEMQVPGFDILIPDATYKDQVQSIADFYIGLFDYWYDKYHNNGVEIRILNSMLKGLLGFNSTSNTIGYGPVTTVTLLTDGSLEALDVMRIIGKGAITSKINILNDEIQDIIKDPTWQEVCHSSIHLNTQCKSCEFMNACGGGPIVTRWSEKNRFDNVSVYCADFKQIFQHMWSKLSKDLYVESV